MFRKTCRTTTYDKSGTSGLMLNKFSSEKFAVFLGIFVTKTIFFEFIICSILKVTYFYVSKLDPRQITSLDLPSAKFCVLSTLGPFLKYYLLNKRSVLIACLCFEERFRNYFATLVQFFSHSTFYVSKKIYQGKLNFQKFHFSN